MEVLAAVGADLNKVNKVLPVYVCNVYISVRDLLYFRTVCLHWLFPVTIEIWPY